jgi:hypothetical protein
MVVLLMTVSPEPSGRAAAGLFGVEEQAAALEGEAGRGQAP